MFKNAIIYRTEKTWQPPSVEALQQSLSDARFAPCAPTQRESIGWAAPRGIEHAAFIESIGGEWLLRLITETKVLPAAVVKESLDEACKLVEAETGRKPGKKARKDLKEEIEHKLLAKAFTKKSNLQIWISPKNGFVALDASSATKADSAVSMLIKALDRAGAPASVYQYQTATSPTAAMSHWLLEGEAPTGFTVDRDCELKSADESKARVKYASHALDIEEVHGHIKAGKAPVSLAMTHADRVSFVLTDNLVLKKIALLDLAFEGRESANGDEAFDADAAIFTGEFGKLIPALIEGLGGELDLAA
jgi:recombination associated protein RdgC